MLLDDIYKEIEIPFSEAIRRLFTHRGTQYIYVCDVDGVLSLDDDSNIVLQWEDADEFDQKVISEFIANNASKGWIVEE